MRYMLDLKLNKKVAFFSLLILSAKAIGVAIADQNNVSTSKVEMPTIDESPYSLGKSNIIQDEALEADACNAPNGDVYVSCQTITKGKGSAEFIKCMEKISPYDQRSGDLCCPNGQETEFYDCQPTPPPTSPPSSGGGGMTLAQKLGLSAGIIAGGLAAIGVAIKAYREWNKRPTNPEIEELLQGIVREPQGRNAGGNNDQAQVEQQEQEAADLAF